MTCLLLCVRRWAVRRRQYNISVAVCQTLGSEKMRRQYDMSVVCQTLGSE